MSTTLRVPVTLCKPKTNKNCFAVMIFPFVTPATRPDAIECTTRSTESEGFLLEICECNICLKKRSKFGGKSLSFLWSSSACRGQLTVGKFWL